VLAQYLHIPRLARRRLASEPYWYYDIPDRSDSERRWSCQYRTMLASTVPGPLYSSGLSHSQTEQVRHRTGDTTDHHSSPGTVPTDSPVVWEVFAQGVLNRNCPLTKVG
jgi:hypothetical protein